MGLNIWHWVIFTSFKVKHKLECVNGVRNILINSVTNVFCLLVMSRANNNTITHLNSQINLMNIPPSYLSPSPSPDELIIQQRGRRKPVTWSPDIDYRKRESVPVTRERTPVKNSPSKSQIVLRSTPRKRLLLNDPKELCLSPEKKKVS